MDTALPQKFPFILDRNLAKANCTGNRVCTSCDTVVLDTHIYMNPSNRCKSLILQSGLRCGEVDVPATGLHHRNERQCGGHVPVTRPQVSGCS